MSKKPFFQCRQFEAILAKPSPRAQPEWQPGLDVIKLFTAVIYEVL